ncbi:hypothetical protein MIMGU_mgv1a0147862mg, partial [Erythranthe guttata]
MPFETLADSIRELQ